MSGPPGLDSGAKAWGPAFEQRNVIRDYVQPTLWKCGDRRQSGSGKPRFLLAMAGICDRGAGASSASAAQNLSIGPDSSCLDLQCQVPHTFLSSFLSAPGLFKLSGLDLEPSSHPLLPPGTISHLSSPAWPHIMTLHTQGELLCGKVNPLGCLLQVTCLACSL